MDESDGEDGASQAEAGMTSDDGRDGGEDGDVADRPSGGNDGGADPPPKRVSIAKPTPHKKGGYVRKTTRLAGKIMTPEQFEKLLNMPWTKRSWTRKAKNGETEIRGGKDRHNHGLALVLDESTDPPVHRLHCTLCGVPIAHKMGHHLVGEKHWNRHLKLVRGGATVPQGGREWYGRNSDPVLPTAPEGGEVDERRRDGIMDPVLPTGGRDRYGRNSDPVLPTRSGIMDPVAAGRRECPVATRRRNEKCEEIVERLKDYAGGRFRPPVVRQDSRALLDILPVQWSDALERMGMARVSNIALDLGRRPFCWRDGQRRYLCDENNPDVVGESDLREIVSKLNDFGEDNRTGMDGQLHRISCVRNSSGEIFGLTIRVGRHLEGIADTIRDLLEESEESILFLGEHGSGKTTAVRDAARILSQRSIVFLVDTFNEIAGYGNVPHPSIGDARRMTVRSPAGRADAMVECVRNHGPSALVVDEISRIGEVEAARTSKNREVRVVAAARGNLRSLIRNAELRGLVGGVKTIAADASVVDEELHQETGSAMVRRAAAPVFDIVVELKSDRLDEWHVVTNAARAVNDILRGRKYDVQKRRRCTRSGEISVEHGKN